MQQDRRTALAPQSPPACWCQTRLPSSAPATAPAQTKQRLIACIPEKSSWRVGSTIKNFQGHTNQGALLQLLKLLLLEV